MSTLLFIADKDTIYLSGLFNITSAAITPGTQPQSHNKNTMKIDPQPLSSTDKGGKKIANNTRQILMLMFFADVFI
jgi:hypothetical protein